MTLDTLPIGRTATIAQVGGEGALRLRLLDMGLIPRTQVTMQKVAPMGDPIEIRVRGYELTHLFHSPLHPGGNRHPGFHSEQPSGRHYQYRGRHQHRAQSVSYASIAGIAHSHGAGAEHDG